MNRKRNLLSKKVTILISVLCIGALALIIFILTTDWTPLKQSIYSIFFSKKIPLKATLTSPYFTKEGKVLLVNGTQPRLTGYNYGWTGYLCPPPQDSELDHVFSQMKNASNTVVVRTAFYQSGSNDGAFTDFDRYIAVAKKYGIYLIPILVNEWKDCEPQGTTKFLPWYQGGYKNIDPGYRLSFKDYAISVARRYANEPTIAWWQLVNEPDARNSDDSCDEPAAVSAIRAFAQDVSSAVKAADPNHLVELGSVSWCGAQGDDLALIYQDSSSDLIDIYHDYEEATAANPIEFQRRMWVISSINKPIYNGESGVCADVTSAGSCSGTVSPTSLDLRASFLDNKMNTAFNTIGLSGYLIWYKGFTSQNFEIGDGDPTEAVVNKYYRVGPPTNSTPTPTPLLTKAVIYDDSLNFIWADWSWGSVVNLATTSPVYSGTRSVAVTYSGWGGLKFHADSGLKTTGYTYLQLAMYGSQTGQKFSVYFYDANGNALKEVSLFNYGGNPPVGSWKLYKIPLSDLSATNLLVKDLIIQERTGIAQPTVYVDEISLIGEITPIGTQPILLPTPTPTPLPLDTTPPSVAVVYPENNALLKAGSKIVIAATASDNVGVTKVEFYLNGTKLLCTDSTPDYTCNWKVPSPTKQGTGYALVVRASDAAGNVGSNYIMVKVSR